MAIKVRDAAASAQKFKNNAAAAQPAYAAGVANAGPTWAAATKAAEDTYQQGVQQAIAQKRFSAGVNATSQSKFQTRAAGVGPQRYAQGVQGAADAWQTGTAPYLQVIASADLPPRGVKGSAQNIQRVQKLAELLRAKKIGAAAA